ncbi:LOW QUALITY PROTEIN: hypothetical protein PHMEG_00013966 [Phytophthora megakarya]|uniref:Uncharacterized protein n=1 Tax=Phytophthora megakarya TaxID=4795 RepID=A0A225W621_9STRA|nr:LOW QUALITY PROTEIN: hypothetical protein PHMEG_00013966 [Phytophthora megakarya]
MDATRGRHAADVWFPGGNDAGATTIHGAAEVQRQMTATLEQQQQSSQQQTTDTSAPDSREYQADGIAMPKSFGKKDDDIGDYMISAKLYFESKNIKDGADAPQQRPLSLLVANLKGPAGA